MEVKESVKNNLVKFSLILSGLFIILSIVIFDEVSFWFLGIAIAIVGFNILYKINEKK